MNPSQARAAIATALERGRVFFTRHALEAIADEGSDESTVIDELRVAVRDEEVRRDRRYPGRWLAFGVHLAVVVEIDEELCVITVFEARTD